MSMEPPSRGLSGTRKRAGSRSRSRGHAGTAKAVGHAAGSYHEHNASGHEGMNGSMATMKMYEEESAVPAWYRTLKKNISN